MKSQEHIALWDISHTIISQSYGYSVHKKNSHAIKYTCILHTAEIVAVFTPR